MIALATLEDYSQIRKIWEVCFTSENKFIENFLNNCLPYSFTFVFKDKDSSNEICSVASVIPSIFKHNNVATPCGYLYGIATLPNHRGNSYGTKLIKHSEEFCKDLGYQFLFLYPASDGLTEHYTNLGFNTIVTHIETDFSVDQLSKNFYDINILEDSTGLDSESDPKNFSVNFEMSFNTFSNIDVKNKNGFFVKLNNKTFTLVPSETEVGVLVCLNNNFNSVFTENILEDLLSITRSKGFVVLRIKEKAGFIPSDFSFLYKKEKLSCLIKPLNEYASDLYDPFTGILFTNPIE